jgi:hypothetical protein
MSENSEKEPPKKRTRQKRSFIWDHFGLDESRTHLVCLEPGCGKTYQFNPSAPRSTTGPRQHLIREHHIQEADATESAMTAKDCDEETQSQGTCRSESVMSFMQKWVHEYKEGIVKRAIALYVALDDASLSCTERPGFRAMMRFLRPDIDRLPVHSTITLEFESLYKEAKAKLLRKLVAHGGPFALTMDGWTSAAHRKYLTFTAHFVDESQLVHYVLSTTRLFIERDAAAQRAALIQTVSTWKIEARIFAVVSDNDRTTCCAIDGALPDISREGHVVHCACHTLQLAVKAAMEIPRVQQHITMWRNVAVAMHASSKWGDMLQLQAEKAHLTCYRPMLDVETRWNSTFLMIDRLTHLRKALDAVFASDEWERARQAREESDRPPIQALVAADYIHMEEFKNVLKPFLQATSSLEGDSYVTMSMVYPVFCSLKRTVLAPKDEDSDFVKDIKNALRKNLMAHWTEKLDSTMALMATFLDPRFRQLPFLTTEENILMQDRFCAEACRLAEAEEAVVGPRRESASVSIDNEEELPPPSGEAPPSQFQGGGEPTEFEKMMTMVMSSAPLRPHSRRRMAGGQQEGAETRTLADKVALEVRMYLAEISVAPKQGPFEWWLLFRSKYPWLWKLAKQYLIIPASSSTSERVFSDAGDVVTKDTASLTDEHVDQKVFLYHNYKAGLFGQ